MKKNSDHALNNYSAEIANLKALIDHTTDLIWSVDNTFTLVTSNRAFKDKVKVSEKTVTDGSRILALDLDLIACYQRALSGESFVIIEYSHDPVELWLEVSFYPILENKEVIGVACYSRDITFMKMEEHRMKLLESVVAGARDAILVTEALPLEGEGPKIVYVNEALVKLTGYTREELLGKASWILYGPKSDPGQIANMVKCLQQCQACDIEIINYKKDGTEFWMHTTVAVITDGNGLSTHVISIGRDVSERFNNVEAIKDQNKKLRDIAWMQSHEVRGPLARITGIVNLLINHCEPDDDNSELHDHLMTASNEMDAIIQKIMKETDEIDVFKQ